MTYHMEEEIQLLKREIEKLKDMLSPIDPHDRAKQRMIESIKKHREFRSKRQWARYARVSMDRRRFVNMFLKNQNHSGKVKIFYTWVLSAIIDLFQVYRFKEKQWQLTCKNPDLYFIDVLT